MSDAMKRRRQRKKLRRVIISEGKKAKARKSVADWLNRKKS